MPDSITSEINPAERRFSCAEKAWRAHEAELRHYVAKQVSDTHLAEDLIQEAFLRAMVQGAKFCTLDDPRAWLFQVCRNLLVDHWRKHRHLDMLPDDFESTVAEETPADEPLDDLLDCIEPNLHHLSASDQGIIRACDLSHQTVQQYADEQGLTLTAAKSRLLRARARLREAMVARCGVQFDEKQIVCCRGDSSCS
jgi:RNA polymerase sigma-70 factor (ECF subfamily)